MGERLEMEIAEPGLIAILHGGISGMKRGGLREVIM